MVSPRWVPLGEVSLPVVDRKVGVSLPVVDPKVGVPPPEIHGNTAGNPATESSVAQECPELFNDGKRRLMSKLSETYSKPGYKSPQE